MYQTLRRLITIAALSFTSFLVSGCFEDKPTVEVNLSSPDKAITLLVDGPGYTHNLSAEESDYYKVHLNAGKNYTLKVHPISGDPDLGIFYVIDQSSVWLGLSFQTGLTDEILTFDAPYDGDYLIEVIGFETGRYSIDIVRNNRIPVANAGSDFEVSFTKPVQLDGSASHDVDNDAITYSWVQKSGTHVALDNVTTESPSFTSPSVDDVLVFELVVDDGIEKSVADSVTVKVKNLAPIISSLSLTPTQAYTTTDLTLTYNVYDVENDAFNTTVTWRKNGIVIPSPLDNTLTANNFVKNDIVSVTIEASDSINATASDVVSVTILDSPPVVSSFSPPSIVQYGQVSDFAIGVSDADGDPITFSVNYGPSELSVNSTTGYVSWTPSGPMFDSEMDVNWQISAEASGLNLNIGSTVKVVDVNRNRPLVRSGLIQEAPGLFQNNMAFERNRMLIADLDADNKNEILIAADNYLYSLEYDGTNYVQDWVYPFDLMVDTTITSLGAEDINSDGKQELFVATSKYWDYENNHSTLFVIDGNTKSIINSYAVSGVFINNMVIDDVNDDGIKEVVFLETSVSHSLVYTSTVNILDLNLNGIWKSSTSDYAFSLVVGNFDADAVNEIATGNGYVIGFDGTNFVDEWVYPSGFGYLIDAADTDGDGIDEIIGVSGHKYVRNRAYRKTIQDILWDYPGSGRFNLKTVDSDSDGKDEVILAADNNSTMISISYDDLNKLIVEDWTVDNVAYGSHSIAFGDVDNDSENELVWNGGLYTAGKNEFYIASINPTLSTEWQASPAQMVNTPFVGGNWAHIGNNNYRAIFANGRTDPGSGSAVIFAIDSVGKVTNVYENPSFGDASRISINIDDYNQDGVSDIFVCSENWQEDNYSYNFTLPGVEWIAPISGFGAVYTDSGDFNGDGFNDVAVINQSGEISVLDVRNMSVIWNGAILGIANNKGVDIEVVDINSDNIPEIIYATDQSIVILGYNGSGFSVIRSLNIAPDTNFYNYIKDIVVGDLDGDGLEEIVVSTSYYAGNENIFVYDIYLNQISSFVAPGMISSIHIEDGSGTRNNLILNIQNEYSLTSNSKSSYIAWVDYQSGTVISRTPNLYGTISKNSLNYVDVNSDGIFEMVFGATYAMYMTQ